MARMKKLLEMSLVFLCIGLSIGQIPSQDIMALVEFKKGIRHDPTGYVLNSWNDESIDFNGCPSSWNGIMCDGVDVAAVVLDDLGLSAEVDLDVLSNLTKLVKLSLSNNSISGKLPENLGKFKSLQYLDISDNMFTSSLPSGIGQLVNLKNLSLAGNNFSGSIPESIVGLASVRFVDMSRNSLSGTLPSSLTRLESLVYLNLSQNGFAKSIPKGFELLSHLEVLDLSGNMLDGDLDAEFLLLTTASIVDFSSNSLVISAKEQEKFRFNISPSIKALNLSHNQLTGLLVSNGEAPLENLRVLDLSYNQFSGDLPGFNFFYDLQVLKLGNNKFFGFIPNNLLNGDSLVLTELDLSGNNLTGSLSMMTSTTLKTLNLSSNWLSGDLPLLVGSCAVIDLSKNQFGGNLSRLLKWESVEFLDLSRNQLSGTLPEVTVQFLRLNYLNLSGNSLVGALPRAFASFPKLTALDLSFNQLDGPLLTDLMASSTVVELHLQSNKLSGGVDFSPSSVNGNENLEVLDLSDNRFDGSLPDRLGSFEGIRLLNIGGNNFSGSLPDSICNLTALTSLDISRNRFTGPLPQNLSADLQSFNASYNDLSGSVPINLRKFPLSSFYPGNAKLQFPGGRPSSDGSDASSGDVARMHRRYMLRVIIILSCVFGAMILILAAVFVYLRSRSRRLPFVVSKDSSSQASTKPSSVGGNGHGSGMSISTKDLHLSSSHKGPGSDAVVSPDEKAVAAMSSALSPSKGSQLSWSPESADSNAAESLARLDVRSPDKLSGELYFLDDTISFTAEELSRAPAEVLGRSSHGTSYRATLENGLLLTVKWLREGVAKQRKEFTKEAKKFANIRHPNVVGLRGYYWGPTQHEKLILSDYISPGSLATFLYDRPGRKGPPLAWSQRLKIAVDIARGLNYLHFDRAVPHGNLKASNVLLDGPDLSGRVADYCLHRLMTQSGTTEQILDAGVLGYRAPELAASKRPAPSFKSDVYAFGVILLELLTGKCAGDVVSGEDGGGVDLTDWVRLRVAEGRGSDCFDAALTAEMGAPLVDKGMKEVVGIALRCIRSVSERPGIKTVYEDLSSV